MLVARFRTYLVLLMGSRNLLLVTLLAFISNTSWAQNTSPSHSSASLRPAIERAKRGTELHIFYVHGMGIEPATPGTQDFETSQEFRSSFCKHLHCTSKSEGRIYANEGRFNIQRETPGLAYFGDKLWNNPEEWHAAAPFVANYTLVDEHGTKIYLHEINWWPLILSAKCRQIVAKEAALVDRDQKHSAICLASTERDETVEDRYKTYAWIEEKDIAKRHAPWRKAASGNRWLKHDILDWGFSDALLAVGPLHKYLIEGIREAILQSFTEADNQEFVVVSHSLGSYLMFSALDLRNNPPASTCDPQSGQPCAPSALQESSPATIAHWQTRFENLLRHTTHAYFMANQLRLLQLANLEDLQGGVDQATSLGTDLNVWADARAEDHQSPPRIVAFSDSDDFLTWQLPPQAGKNDAKNNFVCIEDRPANNASRLLWLFANPITAHLGYDKNNSVIEAMLPKENAKAVANSGQKQTGDHTCQAQ